jgi:hypothetical protein
MFPPGEEPDKLAGAIAVKGTGQVPAVETAPESPTLAYRCVRIGTKVSATVLVLGAACVWACARGQNAGSGLPQVLEQIWSDDQ